MRHQTRRANFAAALVLLVGGLVIWWLSDLPGPTDDLGAASDTTPTFKSLGGSAFLRHTGTKPLTISGDARRPLVPGRLVPLNVTLTNPNNIEVSVTKLTVTVQRVYAPRANLDLPCSRADFTVRPLAAAAHLTVGGGRALTLGRAGLPVRHWPAVGLLNRPVNQDGCKDARLTLRYDAR